MLHYIVHGSVKTNMGSFAGPMEVINYYYLSLSVADLICGIFIVPLSVYPALIGKISPFFVKFYVGCLYKTRYLSMWIVNVI